MTIVAAWMRALTGVGPSIASGSQTWSGNWALLPIAPTKSSSAMPVIIHGAIAPDWSAAGSSWKRPDRLVVVKLSVPTVVQTAMMPSAKPKSPTRLTRNAFLAASAADRRAVPEADQQVARQADQLPGREQQQEVVRQDEQQHAEHEQVEVGEEAPAARVVGHVADRVDVDQHAHGRDHDEQHGGQVVDGEVEVDLEVARPGSTCRA